MKGFKSAPVLRTLDQAEVNWNAFVQDIHAANTPYTRCCIPGVAAIILTMRDSPVQEHIDLIAKHERDFLTRRTWDEKVGDAVSSLVGSLTFVAVHVVGLVAWLAINTGGFPTIKPFDPPPFPILDLTLAFESILLASFILMRQSRIARRTEERNHLELQLMLLTEKELTATLSVCREIAKRLGLSRIVDDHEMNQLSEDISVDQMAESIREKLSEK